MNIHKDQVFGSLNLFKNKPDKLIVIYMDDERRGVHHAKIIYEKGFDNIYLLSGGINIFAHEYPNRLEGTGLQRAEPVFEKTASTLSRSKKDKQQGSIMFSRML